MAHGPDCTAAPVAGPVQTPVFSGECAGNVRRRNEKRADELMFVNLILRCRAGDRLKPVARATPTCAWSRIATTGLPAAERS
ncbi:hypothetical protein GCM10027360_01600 [Amycolatopsis echigonensis]